MSLKLYVVTGALALVVTHDVPWSCANWGMAQYALEVAHFVVVPPPPSQTSKRLPSHLLQIHRGKKGGFYEEEPGATAQTSTPIYHEIAVSPTTDMPSLRPED